MNMGMKKLQMRKDKGEYEYRLLSYLVTVFLK